MTFLYIARTFLAMSSRQPPYDSPVLGRVFMDEPGEHDLRLLVMRSLDHTHVFVERWWPSEQPPDGFSLLPDEARKMAAAILAAVADIEKKP